MVNKWIERQNDKRFVMHMHWSSMRGWSWSVCLFTEDGEVIPGYEDHGRGCDVCDTWARMMEAADELERRAREAGKW